MNAFGRLIVPLLSSRQVSLFAAVCLCGVGLYGQGGSPSLILPGGEETLWENVSESYDEVYRKSTDAVPVERLILPWEATRSVALAIPLGELNENPNLGIVFQDTLAVLLPHVEVLAFHHRLDRRLVGDFLGRLEADARIAPHLGNLILESSDAFSIWMRDFGPQFALGQDGSLVLLDPSIGDPEASRELLFDVKTTEDPLQQHFRMIEELSNLRGLEGSDRIPALMAGVIESRWGVETSLVRPPLFLQGGDFLAVDEKSVLISASTLRVNGGQGQAFRKTLLVYYGVDKAVFLENLPGKTIEHLDFTIQPIAEGVILMAEPPEGIGKSRAYHRLVDRELRQRFARNEASIRESFPNERIVKVPMLPPAFDSDEQVLHELFLRAFQTFVNRERIAFRFDAASALADWSSFSIDPRVAAKLREVTGEDWTSASGQKRIVEQILGVPFDRLLERHVEAQINYRSYVNSLYVKNVEGAEIVLVPRFRALNAAEAGMLEGIEKKVAAAYSSACPNAELVWIDCSVLTDFMGMIHCFTLTVPNHPSLGK